MLEENETKRRLEASPAPRVTEEYILSRISDTVFNRFDERVTICQITLDNGFSVRGESVCVNAANYDRQIGEKYANENAFGKLWELFGFLLAEDQFKGGGLGKLKDITAVQCSKGTWDSDEYMRGMANGMILSVATIENKEPEYFGSPEKEGE